MPENPALDAERKQKLRALVAELKGRGLAIPPDILAELSGSIYKRQFRRSSSGYYFRRDGREFNANEKQERFIHSTARYVGLFAGRGAGKSASASQKSMAKIELGQPGMILNPDFENLKVSTWPEFREWIDWKTVIPRHRYMGDTGWSPTRPFTLAFENGAWVLCKGLKDPDSARGPNVNWLWYDEPGRGDPLGQDWQIANAAVRIGPSPQSWATGTPAGLDHWLYDFFIEQSLPEEAYKEFEEANQKQGITRDLIEVIFTSIEDNKGNLDPGYYASMLAAYPSGWLRQQELYGEFVDHGTAIGDPHWFDGKILSYIPEKFIHWVRFWDLAASEKKRVRGKKLNDPDETVGSLVGWDGKEDFILADQQAGFLEWEEIGSLMIRTAIMDGPHVRIWIESEPGSGGINQVAALSEKILEALPNWMTPKGWKPEGDKLTRANIWFSEASQGHWYMVKGLWNEPFMKQLGSFPIGRHDDRIDSPSGARHVLAPIRMWKKIAFLSLGSKIEPTKEEEAPTSN